MFYALVHYPKIEADPVNQLRPKYDPHWNVIAPHITLLFSIPESIGEQRLVSHIEHVLFEQSALPIRLQGLARSWDDHLLLLVQEGAAELIGLYQALYSGMLAQYLRQDIQFTPHLTLGRFTEQPEKFRKAFDEAQQLNLDYECVMDRVNLVKIDEGPLQIVWSKEFLLQAVPRSR